MLVRKIIITGQKLRRFTNFNLDPLLKFLELRLIFNEFSKKVISNTLRSLSLYAVTYVCLKKEIIAFLQISNHGLIYIAKVAI